MKHIAATNVYKDVITQFMEHAISSTISAKAVVTMLLLLHAPLDIMHVCKGVAANKELPSENN
jgi:hypothetical protein